MKRILAVVTFWATILVWAAPSMAQTMEPPSAPVEGLWDPRYITAHDWPTADAACRAQFLYFASGGTYDGVTLDSGDSSVASCHWHGALIGSAQAFFHCPVGTVQYPSRKCARREDVIPECEACRQQQQQQPPSGGPMPVVGHPISLATGAESETETDYASADGLFAVKRFYRSTQRGRPTVADHELPGFGWAWHGVVPGRLMITGANEETAQYIDDLGTADFFSVSGDSNSFTYIEQGISTRKLSSTGVPTGSRTDFFQNGSAVANGPGEMRIDFGDGEYILFRRADAYRPQPYTRYLVPVEHGFPSGYKQWFDYPDTGEFPTTIRDSFGRHIAIEWQVVANPLNTFTYKVISALHLPDGTLLSYQYDQSRTGREYAGTPQDRLITSKHLDLSNELLWQHSYNYEDARFPFALTGIIDRNNQKIAAFTYSDAGLASSAQLAGGVNRYAVEYLQDAPSQPLQHYVRNVTGPLGDIASYSFFRDANAPAGMVPTLMRIDRAASATVPASSEVFNYTNTNGYDYMLSSVQDPMGTTSAMTVDTVNRRPTATTEAQSTTVARTTNTTWSTQFNLPTREARQGLTTEYSYSTGGQLLSKTYTDTTTQTVPYSTGGQTRTWTYSWNDNGRLLTANGPLQPDAQGKDDTVTFAYDASGNLTSMTDGLGHATQYANYDANGRPGTMTDMNGIVTAFGYDGLGQVKTISVLHPATSSLNAVTTLDYDIEGRVVGMSRPATEKVFFDYNLAGQMIAMRAANGEQIDYAYDPMGNVLSETTKRIDGTAAKTITRTFDSLGRMLNEALGPRRVANWGYDANGNATTLTNPMSNATSQAFDALNRLTSVVAPDGGTNTLVYDETDGVTRNTDPKSVATTFVRNGFGDVIQEASADRGTSVYIYDAAGNVSRSQDGRGQTIDYTRDILGRLTMKRPVGHDTDAVAYDWDASGLTGSYGVGRLGSITDASGTTRFQYDHRGNMLVQQQTVGASPAARLVYAYDLSDRVTQITYPSGRIVQFGRDGKGRISLVQTKGSSSDVAWTAIAGSYAYEPFAAVKTMVLGNGLSVANDWGNDGRLASRRLYRTSGGGNLSYLGYRYDANDNIGAIIDALDDTRSVYYGYDANDRLVRALRTAGTVTSGTETYSYASGTNRLSLIVSAAGTRTFAYDERGNLASEVRPGSISATTTYDSYARLTGYARNDVGTLSFTYNGRDDRVSATTGTSTRHFVYDLDGRPIGEYGVSATDVKAEYIWAQPQVANDNGAFTGDDGAGGYMPLAVATPDNSGLIVLNWVHANHLGVPIVTTDSTGALAATPNDYLAPGFPGQSRTIPDLYYNRYRDYDPSTGRYIQADPIGLVGGLNGYAYASNNPIRLTDPMGLQVGGAIGGAIGGWGGGILCAEAGPLDIACIVGGRWAGRAIGDWCEGTVIQMSKGGKKNIQNEITREIIMNRQRYPDPCKELKDRKKQTKDPKELNKIKQAEKYFNCDGKDRFQ